MGLCFITMSQSIFELKNIVEVSIAINMEMDEILSSSETIILKLFKEKTSKFNNGVQANG